MAEHVLAHIHVPKCAGTSFRHLLDRVFGSGHLHMYFEPGTTRSLPTTFVYADEDIAERLRGSSVRAISSHFIRRFPRELGGRRILYVTFLRQPARQFASYLSFTRRVYQAIEDPILLSHLPPNMPERSLRDCAEWLLRHDTRQFLNFRENYVTNFFARFEAEHRYGLAYSDRIYRWIRLPLAKRVLSRFLFVGISERMDDSWRVLVRRLQSVGLELPVLSVPVENDTGTKAEEVSWLHEQDSVGRLVLAATREDQRLYDWAQRRFERELEEG